MTLLDDFPRPNVAVDIAVLTVCPSTDPRSRPGSLGVLIQKRSNPSSGRALPGRFLRQGEKVTDCIRTALRDKANVDVQARPRLLQVFDDPDRDPRAWTVSLAHTLALPRAQLTNVIGDIEPISANGSLASGEQLLFDHDAIIGAAAADIRRRYERDPDPDSLLDRPFTLADIRALHEAVLGEHLQRDTFRRRMTPNLVPYIGPEGHQASRIDGGRPARLWVRAETLELTDGARRRLQLPRA